MMPGTSSHSELHEVLERRFLAKEGTPWIDIEELESQAYRLVRDLEEQLETAQTTLRKFCAACHGDPEAHGRHICGSSPASRQDS